MSVPIVSNYPFILLRPVMAPPRTETLAILRGINNPAEELAFIFEDRQETDVLAFDIETTGTDVMDPETKVIGVGLADSRGSVYIDLMSSSPDTWPWLLTELGRCKVPLIMHNAYFDYSFIMRDMPDNNVLPILAYCTYALFRLTSTEDWDGFSWGLKAAQKNLLGWHETNEKALDNWLLENGHIKTVKKNWAEGYTWVESIERFCKPDKSKMHLAPADVLGYYCALDADSTYLLFTQVLWPCLERFKALKEYVSPGIYGRYIRLMIEQKFNGMHVDINRMREWNETLSQKYAAAIDEFYQHPDIVRVVTMIKAKLLQDHLEKEPPKWKTVPVAKEPNQFTKTGKVNKGWLKWKAKQEKVQEPETTSRWEQWQEKHQTIKERTPTELLNMNSSKQKQELFYKYLRFPVLSLAKKSGEPATGKDAIKGWGELGKILTKQNKFIKEKQYAEKVIQRYLPSTQSIHPGVLVPGTSSGRLAGAGKMNYQQFPKSYGFLSCIRARPGYKLVDMDFTALESVVLTELSRDHSMLLLYGPDANPNQDIHLFTASNLPGIKEKVRKAGYDPENPTKEGVECAKKECKKEREVAKTINYASVYQAGGKTIAKNLTLNGIPTSEQEGKEMHAAYWETFKGVKEYNKELERQWKLNRGWYLNGIGRPVCITEDMRKDLLSKGIQSTGHDCLVLLMVIYWDLLEKEGIEAHQWGEFHDQVIVEVIEHQAERAKYLLDKVALVKLNEMLGGLIPLRGDAQVVDSLAEVKNLKPDTNYIHKA